MDVLLFCMYVQEYGTDCPQFSQRRVYISYLDSVGYFRPRRARTAVYHQLLISYIEHARKRGYDWVHIWSCPPVRGNNFILWCHPPHQRNPGKERLTSWYHEMLAKAQEQRSIVCVHSLFALSFKRWFVPPSDGYGKVTPKYEHSKGRGRGNKAASLGKKRKALPAGTRHSTSMTATTPKPYTSTATSSILSLASMLRLTTSVPFSPPPPPAVPSVALSTATAVPPRTPAAAVGSVDPAAILFVCAVFWAKVS